MTLTKRPNRAVKPAHVDSLLFGVGRKVSCRCIEAIAERLWPVYFKARDSAGVTDRDALTQLIWEVCGREIRGPVNLSKIEAKLCDM